MVGRLLITCLTPAWLHSSPHSASRLETHGLIFYCFFCMSLWVCLTVLCEQQSECNQHSKTRWGLALCCYQCGKQWLINYVCRRHCAHYDSGKLSVTFSDPSHPRRKWLHWKSTGDIMFKKRAFMHFDKKKKKHVNIINQFCIKMGLIFMALPQSISAISACT